MPAEPAGEDPGVVVEHLVRSVGVGGEPIELGAIGGGDTITELGEQRRVHPCSWSRRCGGAMGS